MYCCCLIWTPPWSPNQFRSLKGKKIIIELWIYHCYCLTSDFLLYRLTWFPSESFNSVEWVDLSILRLPVVVRTGILPINFAINLTQLCWLPHVHCMNSSKNKTISLRIKKLLSNWYNQLNTMENPNKLYLCYIKNVLCILKMNIY